VIPIPDGADFRRLRAWRNAEDTAVQLERIVGDLDLTPDREWLRYVLSEAISQLRSVVGYVEMVPEPDPGGQPNFEAFAVAASAARTSVVFIDYALAFMASEKLIAAAVAAALHARLRELEAELVHVSNDMRQANLAYQPDWS
jgi:hypothetical protein